MTVVTDLATPHPFWLHPSTDLCFVPSDAFVRAALLRGFHTSQLREHGLPVRPSFAQGRADASVAASLGLRSGHKTILVVGGGDGVGKLDAIVYAMAARLAKHNEAGGDPAQMVVICGKNYALRQRLKEQSWGPNLHVVVEGFVTRMNDYMATADCIVTKAGPGAPLPPALPCLLFGADGVLCGAQGRLPRHAAVGCPSCSRASCQGKSRAMSAS